MHDHDATRETAFSDVAIPEEPAEWQWKRLRDFGFGVEIWPVNWSVMWGCDDDEHGGEAYLHLGPIGFRFIFNEGFQASVCKDKT